jgi:hypothetical protein
MVPRSWPRGLGAQKVWRPMTDYSWVVWQISGNRYSRAHAWEGDIRTSPRRTACGLSMPLRSRWSQPMAGDQSCSRCEKALAELEKQP